MLRADAIRPRPEHILVSKKGEKTCLKLFLSLQASQGLRAQLLLLLADLVYRRTSPKLAGHSDPEDGSMDYKYEQVLLVVLVAMAAQLVSVELMLISVSLERLCLALL